VCILIPSDERSIGAAAVVGTTMGTALALDPKRALFMVVVPIMASGVGEGALALSAGIRRFSSSNRGRCSKRCRPQ